MTKHTPGPWISEDCVAGRPPEAGCGIIASDDDFKISNPTRGIVAWASRIVSRPNEETLANARLIAAAPDLLEACELVIGSLSFDREDDFSKEVIRRLTAAIAKATRS